MRIIEDIDNDPLVFLSCTSKISGELLGSGEMLILLLPYFYFAQGCERYCGNNNLGWFYLVKAACKYPYMASFTALLVGFKVYTNIQLYIPVHDDFILLLYGGG